MGLLPTWHRYVGQKPIKRIHIIYAEEKNHQGN